MQLGHSRWQALNLIPNTSGYPLTIITRNGSTHRVRVKLDIQSGTHKLELPEGVQYSDVMGWKP